MNTQESVPATEPEAEHLKVPASTPRSKPNANHDLKSLPIPEVEKQLRSSPDGLTQAEAQKRLTQYGPNEIEENKTNPFLKFLTYFWGPIPWMIEAAVILSGVVRHWADFFIILLLLVSNAAVGFWEEHQAGNAIAALKAKLVIKARVKRDGKWANPAARELVPGDVIRIRLGDIVPADCGLWAVRTPLGWGWPLSNGSGRFIPGSSALGRADRRFDHQSLFVQPVHGVGEPSFA